MDNKNTKEFIQEAIVRIIEEEANGSMGEPAGGESMKVDG